MKTKKNSKSTSRKVQVNRFELWILDKIFQPWCDFTHRYLGLNCIFWAVVCVAVLVTTLVVLLYRGIYTDHDPLVILPVCMAVCVLVLPQIRVIRKMRYDVYDDLMYGRKNQYRYRYAEIRRSLLGLSVMVVIFNILIATRHHSFDIVVLIMWIFMTGYPTYCFCSCTPLCRRR